MYIYILYTYIHTYVAVCYNISVLKALADFWSPGSHRGPRGIEAFAFGFQASSRVWGFMLQDLLTSFNGMD